MTTATKGMSPWWLDPETSRGYHVLSDVSAKEDWHVQLRNKDVGPLTVGPFFSPSDAQQWKDGHTDDSDATGWMMMPPGSLTEGTVICQIPKECVFVTRCTDGRSVCRRCNPVNQLEEQFL
jgi:hypothetical protein